MKIKTITIAVVFCVTLLSTFGFAKDEELAVILSEKKLTGTIIIESLDGKVKYVHNNKRAKEQLMPGETFEIPLTLIALSTKNLKDEQEVLQWDGRDKGLRSWNRDQNLKTASATSCQWFFQNLALRIGDKELKNHLRKLSYGNRNTAYDVTSCWFDGRLEISAFEQMTFLKKFYNGKFDYPEKYVDLVKELLPISKKSSYTLRGKKGVVKTVLPYVGWYIGYVENSGKIWFFVVNVDLPKNGYSKYPWYVTSKALKVKKIF